MSTGTERMTVWMMRMMTAVESAGDDRRAGNKRKQFEKRLRVGAGVVDCLMTAAFQVDQLTCLCFQEI